jgi:integrase
VDRFLAYRAEHTRLDIRIGARRALARSWNRCREEIPRWPTVRLCEPPLPNKGISDEELPAGLRDDIDAFCAELRQPRLDHRGKRLRPSKASTIRTRRAELMAFIAKAVECGIPLHSLTSLKALLQPEVVEPVLDSYWRDNGQSPTVYTIDMAWKLLGLARRLGSLDPAALERIEDFRGELEQHRQPGLTEKNRALIRQVLVDDVWRSVMSTSDQLLAKAGRQHNEAPVRAAVSAGIAVAIRILLFAPIRVGNLVAIRIGENLIQPAPSGPYWIVFPDYDVKNRVPLEFELDEQTTAMIERYRAEFRPALLRGAPSAWLFPGEPGEHKDPSTLSDQITRCVFGATGVRLTAHQFRHAAAAIFLRHRPGEYELVRRLLGHRSIRTTMNFYAGLESLQATRIFGEIVERELALKLGIGEPVTANPASASRRRRRRKVRCP